MSYFHQSNQNNFNNIYTYATISKGFKSSGFNNSKADKPSFEPELLWAYEVGIKSDLLAQN